MRTFNAFVIDLEDGKTKLERKQVTEEFLGEGEVTIEVAYSSVNYKDGLATLPKQIIRNYPLIPGIDLSGTVIESKDDRFKEGDEVIATSYEIGVSHHGGFSEIARVPADWVVPLPDGLSLKEAMVLGTAGFTAALSVQKLEDQGITPEAGPVLVTGATGGVGSVAVDILAKNGYEVHASTGKESEHGYLRELGAAEILNREDLTPEDRKPLRKEMYAAAVDPVGGRTLEHILSTLKYGGSVATSGLTGGNKVETTVFPFILRGINWLGVDSVFCPMDVRKKIWDRLASDYKPNHLTAGIVNEITLDELPDTLSSILKGEVRGRTIVKLK
ncbi:NADPH:quinone oxidoreductase family protein [Alkalihalophilus marmarensis]|uniref:NADPH:quinone oxidoreductase family protein n=1 Tax=Alkalihalophilus marmarensis TaxID=521377 RepID=UPI002DBE3E06|nr:acryloyl-CoA reductase [Alkalihalophilus marmarensis]MEC2072804.1 acryloyl-CoA reductase [Alkalihalophilus marmarensis]